MAAEPLPPGISQELFDELVRAVLGELTTSAAALALGPDFDSTRFAALATKWAEKRAGELIKDLASTDQEILVSALAQAESEGWSQSKLRDFLSEGSYDPNRVATIARTERGFATNAGNVIGLKADGHEYFVVLDSPGCLPKGHVDGSPRASRKLGVVEEDREANGQIWTAEQVLEYLLGHPNCERAFRPATALELEELGLAA